MYHTKIVIDMGTSEVLKRVSVPYKGPWSLLKPHKSGVEAGALADQSQLQNQSTNTENTAQNTLSQFEGPVQSSPYYQSLLSTGTDATTQAYNNAQQSERANANEAGFGTGQPIGTAGDTAVQAQEAGALAKVPAQAAQQASQASLQAAGQTANLGESQGQQANSYLNSAIPLEEQYQNMLNSFQNRLWNVGAGAAYGAATSV